MRNSADQTLILGGGFAGLFTALQLSRQGYLLPVVLIDQGERFVFKPLLYELLSGEMSSSQVCPRYEDLLNNSGVKFLQDRVQGIDLPNQQVELRKNGSVTYQNLVLALGSIPGFFGIEGAQENTLTFHSGQDAIALSKHLRNCLKQAVTTANPEQRRTLLTVAIVGAGPAGVELAATLTDLLERWYSQLGGDAQEIHLVLLNRGSQILNGDINHHLRQTVKNALIDRTVPVELLMDASVSAVYPQSVEFERNGQRDKIKAATIIWTAGTRVHPLIKALPIPEAHRGKKGRLLVTSTMQLSHFSEVFAGGDCATNEQSSLPPTAQVAYQQGTAIAQGLKAVSKGKAPSPAQVQLRGSLLKLGLDDAGANLFDRFTITGKAADLIRQGRYLTVLPTPTHNFKAIAKWLTDKLVNPSGKRISEQKQTSYAFRWIAGVGTVAVLGATGLFMWRVTQPEKLNRVWQKTGLPSLLEWLPSTQKSPEDYAD